MLNGKGDLILRYIAHGQKVIGCSSKINDVKCYYFYDFSYLIIFSL